ncbi:integrase core domain-containing protein, partial [Rhodococcus sp. TAF43]|uniref:integrase core domain-containing protein n=1 Tax=Rhodococcus sp. TAF43 TaxID=3237483 RepID=UPI003F9A52D7
TVRSSPATANAPTHLHPGSYRQVFTSNSERADALAPWLEYYNTRRRHSALGGLPPISRLQPT